jgi:hypothetical protein
MPTNTPNYNFLLPVVGADTNDWGGFLNTNWTNMDAFLTSLFSTSRAATRPADIRQGGLWVASGSDTINYYNGTSDIPLLRVTSNGPEVILANDATDYIGRNSSVLSLFMNSVPVVAITDNHIRLIDDYELQFGTDGDTVLKHDDTDGFSVVSTVDLTIETTENLLVEADKLNLTSTDELAITADSVTIDATSELAITAPQVTINGDDVATDAAVDARIVSAEARDFGWSQTWQDVTGSRTHSTSYQNTTGRPIAVSIRASTSTTRTYQVSTDDATWIAIGEISSNLSTHSRMFIVPNGHYYRVNGAVTIVTWVELR